MAKERKISYIVVHCTATLPTAEIAAIQKYWRKILGWMNPGYHYLIDKDGVTHQLLPEDEIANGAKGYNHNAIHVSYIGGVDRHNNSLDTRTPQQKTEMYYLITMLMDKYRGAQLLGHCDLPGVIKACPCFDVGEWYSKHPITLTT